MTFEFEVSDVIPASPQAIYDAWLDSQAHAAMTGGEAHTSTALGDPFDAWGGYINGRNLELIPGQRIVQAWRTTNFTDQDEDSKIDISLEAVAGGTRVTVHHSNVPAGHDGYRDGWTSHYFTPMKAYFSERA